MSTLCVFPASVCVFQNAANTDFRRPFIRLPSMLQHRAIRHVSSCRTARREASVFRPVNERHPQRLGRLLRAPIRNPCVAESRGSYPGWAWANTHRGNVSNNSRSRSPVEADWSPCSGRSRGSRSFRHRPRAGYAAFRDVSLSCTGRRSPECWGPRGAGTSLQRRAAGHSRPCMASGDESPPGVMLSAAPGCSD
jgi:hypothetical protein